MMNELKKQAETNTLPRKQFSKQDIALMKQTNLIQFTLWFDDALILKKNGSYRLVNNFSIVLKNNIAYDFANGTAYNPIDYCTKILGLKMYAAFYVLYTYSTAEIIEDIICKDAYVKTAITKEKFEENMNNGKYYIDGNNNNIYAYLCSTRKISKKMVDFFFL